MNTLRLDHIGFAVEKIDAALPVGRRLGLPLHGIEEVADRK